MKKNQMKATWLLLMFVSFLIGGLTSCADREDGEDNETYKMRNSINGPAWRIYSIKIDGKWYYAFNEDLSLSSPMWFEVKFSASKKTYDSEKFYYDNNGVSIESTRQKYNNAPYTIDKKQVVAYTDDSMNTKYFTLNIVSCDSELKGSVTFHDENKTYEVIMQR